ncbi:unnamed protein product [Protopolystoma xenopodis]|uniref:Uncharacterized protein n=1 Tax=Protopolystoma xenopodis TaxID=117903 RepID=A0A448WKK3_9PLAT|nr:unnamed protein product [Protopolystoma xenopodis]
MIKIGRALGRRKIVSRMWRMRQVSVATQLSHPHCMSTKRTQVDNRLCKVSTETETRRVEPMEEERVNECRVGRQLVGSGRYNTEALCSFRSGKGRDARATKPQQPAAELKRT